MLEAMIAKGAKDPFVHYARALELRGLGRREDALAALEEVARSFPAYVPTYLIAGQLATELGRRDDARDLLARGLEQAAAAGDAKARGEIAAALDALEPI